MRRSLISLALLLATIAAVAATLVLTTLATLAPGPAAWTLPLRLTVFGDRFERPASVPILLRLATHPLAARVVDGRQIETTHGRWELRASASGGLDATCAPCHIRVAALGATPLELERLQLTLVADGADQYHGSLQLGAAPATLALAWRGRIGHDGRLQLDATLPTTPMQHAVHVFGLALPERTSVRVEGTLALALKGRLPDGPWQLKPQIGGFAVHGLGTEQLLDLQRPAACRDGSDASVPTVGGWLPRAVVAAEDQRFFEHPGYDLTAMLDAWQHNQKPGAPIAGASTLTQQLAKLTITGDQRSATRKLRELLYAVEMERTLGKARILQLYLALAPWGEGVCGAERAVRVHLGYRDASTVGPLAAAWLASLLTAPDAHLRAEQAAGQVDGARVTRVLEAIRPLRSERREKALATLPFWSPPALARPRQAAPVPAEEVPTGSPSP
jgi:hypothetical protein